MEIIPPVEIGLLVNHATLPTREGILSLFAEHYRTSLERAEAAAEAAALADELGGDALADVLDVGEPLADLGQLAAMGGAAAEPAGEVLEPSDAVDLGGFDLDGADFDLGDDPFATLDLGDDEERRGGDVFALADEPAVVEESVSALLEDEEALGAGDDELVEEARATADDEPLPDELVDDELLADELLADDALLADLDDVDAADLLDEEEARELGVDLSVDGPSVVVVEDELAVEAEPEDATTMIRAMPDDDEPESAVEEAEPEDATTMIQAMPDDDEPESAVEEAEPEDATTMDASGSGATPDDDELDGPDGAESESAEQDAPRPTRRSRRASRKSKKK